MKRFLIVLMVVSAGWLHAASVKSGNERLRQLVVTPVINLQVGWQWHISRADFIEDHLVPGEIEKLRKEAKENPEEPERLLRLGELLNSTGETNEARGWFERAEKAARKKSELRPSDGLALVSLANALAELGRLGEVESLLRRATLVSSNEWKCWSGLGRYLGSDAFNEILPPEVRGIPTTYNVAIAAAADYQPPAGVLTKAGAMRKESEACYDRAVALAPKEPDAYLDRACIEQTYAMLDFLERFYRDKQSPKKEEVVEVAVPAGLVRDLKQAAQLCPDDVLVVTTAAWTETSHVLMEENQKNPNADFSSMKSIPDKARDSLRAAMDQLERLSRSPDKARSASALENLGILKMMTQNFTGATEDLRRALTLEPAREKAWEGLLGVQVNSDASPEEVVKTCRGLVKNKDCCRSRLFLAKALMKQNKFDEAKAEIKKAMQWEPNNVLASSFAAAVSLKLAVDENSLSEATTQMVHVKDLLDKVPDNDDRTAQWREVMLNGAILCGLLDKPADAKDWLRAVLGHFPDDQTAKEILSAIR